MEIHTIRRPEIDGERYAAANVDPFTLTEDS